MVKTLLVVAVAAAMVASSEAAQFGCSGVTNTARKAVCLTVQKCLDAFDYASWPTNSCGNLGGNPCGMSCKKNSGVNAELAIECDSNNNIEQIKVLGSNVETNANLVDEALLAECMQELFATEADSLTINFKGMTDIPFETACTDACTDVCKFNPSILDAAVTEYGITKTDFVDDNDNFANFDGCAAALATAAPVTSSPTMMPTDAPVTAAPTDEGETRSPTIEPATMAPTFEDFEEGDNSTNTTNTTLSPTTEPTTATPTAGPTSDATGVAAQIVLSVAAIAVAAVRL